MKLAARFVSSRRYQIFVLEYNDLHRRASLNGTDLAEELKKLSKFTHSPRITIVAYSVGGIIARRAMNELAYGPGKGIERFRAIRIFAVDTPWHGFPGPPDTGASGFFFHSFIRHFLPDGPEDIRAESSLFRGDPRDPNPAARHGLSEFPLPSHVRLQLLFAERGEGILDYTDKELGALPALIAEHFNFGRPIRGGARLKNFWNALVWADAFLPFLDELETIALSRLVRANDALGLLQRYYPRFPGDHHSILREHPGRYSFLDHLTESLAR